MQAQAGLEEAEGNTQVTTTTPLFLEQVLQVRGMREARQLTLTTMAVLVEAVLVEQGETSRAVVE
jgi:hypothetical protein|tara:strand:- start:358 stop:552 length:195 start_codon:yes stop_codon:yes gene_type:complete